ncbi:HlyD family efflux transporter periplasmic adaptor subunit [uncultured Nostoc sp.]|uniref:HlyD family efflux transporter periplasmic adaptor subunit n=1 Tax=uncultured Nostoc sp. TaxID=340711 RepID=UPI0035CBD4F2
MKLPLASSSSQTRQTREQFANPDAYLDYELGKAVQELPPLYTRLVAVSLSLGLFGAIAWAAFSKVDEVAVAHGEIIPSEQVQPVRSLGGGIIQSINVKEGQQVKKGEPLISLDSKQSQVDIDRLRQQAGLISADIRRANEATAKGHQARLKEAEIELKRLQDNLKSAQRDANRLRRLVGAIPRLDYEHAQDKARDIQKSIAVQYKKIQQLQEDYKSENLSQLSKRREELQTVQRQLDQSVEQLQQQFIKAPISGTIYNINVNAGKGTVQSGEELLSILPEGKEPVLEVYLPNQYRGFVDEGMKAKVKIDAFPYQEFGIIDGAVIYVSPNAVVKDKTYGKSVFPTRIKLNKLSVVTRGQEKKLTSGMEATGEIVMRQKSVLSLLIEPVTRKFDEVFSQK